MQKKSIKLFFCISIGSAITLANRMVNFFENRSFRWQERTLKHSMLEITYRSVLSFIRSGRIASHKASEKLSIPANETNIIEQNINCFLGAILIWFSEDILDDWSTANSDETHFAIRFTDIQSVEFAIKRTSGLQKFPEVSRDVLVAMVATLTVRVSRMLYPAFFILIEKNRTDSI